MRKFATKISSRQNSVNQYFGMQIHILYFNCINRIRRRKGRLAPAPSASWSPLSRPCWHKTHCQDGCRSLSGGVTKNLTLHWMKKIFFSFYHHKRQIRSFPTMYNTWGCFLVQFGWKKCFIQKSTLKWGFFLDTVLDHLTSEAAGTHNFKDIANFHRCFKKSGT